ncbi:MAG TPA: methyltransferase domain-containing protein, partial [Gemmatimonadaceae bacterium]
ATIDLAEYFDEVVATDLSQKQLVEAPDVPNVGWVAARAEAAPIRTASIDLVTVAQALHWFDHGAFFAEVRRVATPGAAVAAWTYGVPKMDGEVGEALNRLMFETLGGYWPPGRGYVEDEYRSIPFPFERLPAPKLPLHETWTFARVAGYARTWSASARYAAATGVDAVESFEREARAVWTDDAPRAITWPLVLLAGRVS